MATDLDVGITTATGSNLLLFGTIDNTSGAAKTLTFRNNSTAAANNPNTTVNSSIGGAGNSTITIVNAGTGGNLAANRGVVTLAGTLGSNVTSVTQNSATSRLIISGTSNAYTGVTTVSAGSLRVTSSIATSSGVTVDNGTLEGTGTVPAITLNANTGGKVSPGDGGIGTLGGASMTWNSDNTQSGGLYELGSTTGNQDTLALTAASIKGTGSSFLFDFAGGTAGQTYTLITYASTTFTPAVDSGEFALSAASQASGYAGTFSVDADSVDFTPTAVPEPAALSLLGLGGLALVRRRRRR